MMRRANRLMMLQLHPGALALAAWVALMVVGVWLGFQEPLSFAAGSRGGQGIDFFCVPKAFLNWVGGTSAFDTWGPPAYAPHATWFVLHPAVALWIGGLLCWLPPAWAYGSWVAITLGALLGCGLLLARHVDTPARRTLVVAALLCSPITYLLLLTGNVHGVIVVAAVLLFIGLHEQASGAAPALGVSPSVKVGAGMLLSLLCKPVLLLVAPALVIVRATRAAALASVGAYVLASALFVLVPVLNPEAVGLERLAWLALHPEWVKAQLEVYRHGFVLVPEMLDNAMHWFHMLAQSDNAWDHIQVFSLPVMVRSYVLVPPGAFRWAALLPAGLSPLLLCMPEARRLVATAWLVVLALASHFLGYAIAWEYQYAQLLAVAAVLLALPTLRAASPRSTRIALCGLALLYLPTPYVWLKQDGISVSDVALMRACRVGPALLTAAAAISAFLRQLQRQTSGAEVAPAPAPVPSRGVHPALGLALGALLLVPPALLLAKRGLREKSVDGGFTEQIDRSRALLDAGEARASLVPLARAERVAPDAFAVQNNLCVAYGMLDRKDEAVDRCRRAVAIQPGNTLVRNNLAWVEGIQDD